MIAERINQKIAPKRKVKRERSQNHLKRKRKTRTKKEVRRRERMKRKRKKEKRRLKRKVKKQGPHQDLVQGVVNERRRNLRRSLPVDLHQNHPNEPHQSTLNTL